MAKPRILILLLAAALAVTGSSCGKKVVLTDIEESELVPGEGVEAAATFIDDEEAFRSLLKCVPPDSGVVPVWVTVRNVDTVPVRIHDLNYLPLGETFRGFTLEVGESALDPVHPLEAVMYIKGKADIPNYREIRAGHVVGGMIIWPLGVYYIFRGVQYSREYKPLLKHSFFPAGRGGHFEPVTIEPGQAASGFVYFALLPDDNPYYREEVADSLGGGGGDRPGRNAEVETRLKVRSGSGLRLNVNPAVKRDSHADCETEVDSLRKFKGLKSIRGEHGLWEGGAFVALAVNGDRGGKLDLVTGTAENLFESRSLSGLTVIAELRGKDARLADASSWGAKAVCAVNSKQSSRIYLIGLDENGPALVAEGTLDSKVISVIAAEDAAYITNDAGFCYTFSYGELEAQRYLNISYDVSAVVLRGGSLITFGKNSAEELGIRPGRNPERLGKTELISTGKRDAGLTAGGIAVTHEGRGTHGDTLVLYDRESLAEIERRPFPGKLDAVEISPGGIIAQMAGGMLMRLVRRGEGYGIEEAGWVPYRAGAVCGSGGIVALLSEEGGLYSFDTRSLTPRPLREGGAVNVPVRTGTPYGEQEKKAKRKR